MRSSAVATLLHPVKRVRWLSTTACDDVYDVAIVGAGMVGAAVAALLGRCYHAKPIPPSLIGSIALHTEDLCRMLHLLRPQSTDQGPESGSP